MDSSDNLIASAVLNANLLRSRISVVDGKVGVNKVLGGGILTTETTVKFFREDGPELRWLCEVALVIRAYPKGTTEDQMLQTEQTFSIAIVVQGSYSWETEPSDKVTKSSKLLHALGRPLYLVAAAEARAVALKLGFSGVKPPSDLPRDEPHRKKALAAAKKKRIAPAPDVQDAVVKPPMKAARKRTKPKTKLA